MGAPFPTPVATLPVATDPARAVFGTIVLDALKGEIGETAFGSWFGRLELDRIDGATAHLTLPTKFLASWVSAHYSGPLFAAMLAGFSTVSEVRVGVRTAARAAPFRMAAPAVRSPIEPSSYQAQQPVASAATREPLALGSSLDRRLTFDTFLVGRSNQLAHAAAQRIASGDPQAANPLFLHGAVGLGKTHLLQATARAAEARGRRVLYLTAERFMYGFVAALKAQSALTFRERLRGIDLLVIDDVQFLQGKSVQHEFGLIVGAIIENGSRLIVAADRPPSDLESLDERTRSRLGAGLAVEIAAPDEALRVRMLKARVAAIRATVPTFDISPAVIAYVASAIQTNGRDLDGAVNRLMAHASVANEPLTVATAEPAIRDLIRAREPKKVKIEDIQRLVANHYNVTRGDIMSARRTANVVWPRQVAMYLAKTMTLRSLPEIGRRFGGKDHTTILHAVRKIEGLTGKDPALADEVNGLRRMLEAA